MDLDEAIRTAFAAGRTAWPRTNLAEQAFSVWIKARNVGPGELEACGSDLYLAAACTLGDAGAVESFDRAYVQTVRPTLGRVALDPHSTDELRQTLRVRLLTGAAPRIGQYGGYGPLGAWVRVAAARVALELKEAERRDRGDAEVVDKLVSSGGDAELLVAKLQHKDALSAALEESFTGLAAREKTLLRMHFLEQMTIDEMGVVFRVHRATVARWLVGIRHRILRQLCTKMSMDLDTSASEINSLIRLVRSDIELSVRRLLEPGDGSAINRSGGRSLETKRA
jgi:RNA polymerase sigma-70 factor, ECF subfamily